MIIISRALATLISMKSILEILGEGSTVAGHGELVDILLLTEAWFIQDGGSRIEVERAIEAEAGAAGVIGAANILDSISDSFIIKNINDKF